VGTTLFANIGATPIENFGHNCTTASTTVLAPGLAPTKDNSLNVLQYGITNDNSITRPTGYSLTYSASISSTGPNIELNSDFCSTTSLCNNGVNPNPNSVCISAGNPNPCCTGSGTGNCLSTSATAAGDSIGYQLNLSPLP